MQQQSEKFSEYSERTEVLARNLGVNISDLPVKIGVSNSMFHAYRSGKYPISNKAWRKLEQAEEAHARTHLVAAQQSIQKLLEPPGIAESSANPKHQEVGEAPNLLREEPVKYGVKMPTREDQVRQAFAEIRRGLDRLERILLNPPR